MRSIVLALLVLAPVPLATAGCVLDVCVSETSDGSPDCATPGDFGSAETRVDTPAASVSGSMFCYNDFENGRNVVTTVSVSAAGQALVWSGSATGCAMYAYVAGGEEPTMLPCVVGPPNPGWGHLLP